MRSKIVLVGMLLMNSPFLSDGGIAYAIEGPQIENSEESSNYFFIYYNGSEQKIIINENITLVLTGWTDESKSSVDGKIDIQNKSSNQVQDITFNVNDELNTIVISDTESIKYRILASDLFKAEEVKPLELNEKISVMVENENGTSIEELKIIDENGTVIQNRGLIYYSINENNQKIMISKEEYYSINVGAELSREVISSSDNVVANSLVTESSINSIKSMSSDSSGNPTISYSSHVQDFGWLTNVSDGKTSGTVGQAKRLEAIKISLENAPYSGGISYKTHVQNYGWLNNVSDGAISGTSGESKRLEAIQINLNGEMANYFDVYYRVHAQNFGWLDWAKNGESAGTQGLATRLEAIEIVLVAKGGAAPGATNKPFVMIDPSVVYTSHVQDYGWLINVADGKTSGTIGQAKRMEAMKIFLINAPYSGGISYKTHVQGYGWMNNVTDGAITGTTGESKRIEAIQINLTGEMANHFDIYYRSHSESYGWLDWAKNGESAGTQGLSKRMEAVEVVLVKKGGAAPGFTNRPFVDVGLFINYDNYNITLNDALNMQMKVLPQTDKYSTAPAYASSQYITVYNGGSISGNGVNLRTSPTLSNNIDITVGKGTLFKILDDNITGDMVSGSTRWYKIEYNGKILYVHCSLATNNLRLGQVTADSLSIRSDKNTNSHIFGTVKKDTVLTILEEKNDGWYRVSYGAWRNATASDVLNYLDPSKFVNDPKQRFQFMNLTKMSGISAETLNKYLIGKGILENQGQAFIEAGQKYGINEVYLMAHTLLETGNGTSTLAKGIVYNEKTVYNMYGIGAIDSNPIESGAKTAYEKGWFTPYAAIVGGASFIDNSYLSGNNYSNTVQNTLFEMRWNPEIMASKSVASHQYASDIGWAYKQVNTMYEVYQIQPFTIYLELPVFK